MVKAVSKYSKNNVKIIVIACVCGIYFVSLHKYLIYV